MPLSYIIYGSLTAIVIALLLFFFRNKINK